MDTWWTLVDLCWAMSGHALDIEWTIAGHLQYIEWTLIGHQWTFSGQLVDIFGD